MTNTVRTERRIHAPGCLVQLLWFLLVGWWAGQLWAMVAWAFMVSVVGMPIGILMLHQFPMVIALRRPEEVVVKRVEDRVAVRHAPQVSPLLRVIYVLFIGWWLSAVWIEVMWALMVSVIGMPLGFWMLDRVPMIVSLQR